MRSNVLHVISAQTTHSLRTEEECLGHKTQSFLSFQQFWGQCEFAQCSVFSSFISLECLGFLVLYM